MTKVFDLLEQEIKVGDILFSTQYKDICEIVGIRCEVSGDITKLIFEYKWFLHPSSSPDSNSALFYKAIVNEFFIGSLIKLNEPITKDTIMLYKLSKGEQ